MAVRTVTMDVVVDVGNETAERAAGAKVSALLANAPFILKIGHVEEIEGEPAAVEGKEWLEIHKEASNG
jgi:hypothetical protein